MAFKTFPQTGGALTLVSRTSFSNVASQAFDNVFNSTYATYYVSIDNIYAATAGDDLQMQMRYGTTTFTGANYESAIVRITSAAITSQGAGAATQFTLARETGDSTYQNAGGFYIRRVGQASMYPQIIGLSINDANGGYNYTGGGELLNASQTFTGFLLKSGSTNITGTVTIYGLAAA